MPLSDSSELSSPPSSAGEGYIDSPPKKGIAKFFLKSKAKTSAGTEDDSPPRKPRSPSPPHEYGLADNPDIAVSTVFIEIACPNTCTWSIKRVVSRTNWVVFRRQFIVMFRSRFHEVFPASLISFGPQDLERGAVEPVPGPQIESLLCALLGLVLNRKKYVE